MTPDQSWEVDARGRALIDALIDSGEEGAVAVLPNLVRRYRKSHKEVWTKSRLLEILDTSYREDPNHTWLKKALTKRPIRTLSGITSITVLTKPYPCPGRCVFCPVDVRMPKSYIATEPGARRAGRLGFDPYQQVTQRLRAYVDMGHPVSKVELIVLGGSWSAYEREYQRWFIKRLFDALNDFGVSRDDTSHAYDTDWDDHIAAGETYNAHINASKYVTDPYVEIASAEEVEEAQRLNETASSRCIGLSLETRPDLIDVEECTHLRWLGATKIQIGLQSLDDTVLRMNKRGHKVAQAERALRMLRSFGFKIHAHWMPNLYGSSVDADIADYQRVFGNPSICPDELKVYPTSLIADTELEQIANRGEWSPYSDEELTRVLSFVLTNTPEYCRLTRIIRDIPSSEILVGNKKGNFRQIVENGIASNEMRDIRAREIKNESVDASDLVTDHVRYETTDSVEYFVQLIRPSDRKIAGFVRLSLPSRETPAPIAELEDKAIIREVHVYGQSVGVGSQADAAQHRGLGRQLVQEACDIAAEHEYASVAIISAIGTRKYYEKLGFVQRALYQHKSLAGAGQVSAL